MATLVVHALAPLAAQHAFDAEPRRRIALAALFCACWPDLDIATYALELRPPDEFAHGGATHSIYAAAAAALLVTGIAFDDLGIFTRAWRRVAWFLFGAALSHPLLDMLTAGDAGVALLWPFTDARAHLPWKLLPSTELGFDEYLSFWGLLTIANEVLYVVVPIAIVASLVRGAVPRARVLRGAAGWLV
ncbi:MAG TPA: metal-dependent hydrolase, partial [Labilithrix sp.]